MDGNLTAGLGANRVWADKSYIVRSRGFPSSSTTTGWVKIRWVMETANSDARVSTPTTASRLNTTISHKSSWTKWRSLLLATWDANMVEAEPSSQRRDN